MDQTDANSRSPRGWSPQLKFLPKVVLAAAGVVRLVGAAPAQPPAETPALTLRQAVQIALEKNPQRKVAMAETTAAWADVHEARSAFMPKRMFPMCWKRWEPCVPPKPANWQAR